MTWKFDAVVVSDLHLGARNARTEEILDFLSSVDAQLLVVNGDLFESPKLAGLQPRHIAVLEALRSYAQRAELVLLHGNHDPPESWYHGVLGLPVHQEIRLDWGGQSYLITHGHRWDRAMRLPWPIIRSADAVYHACQLLDPTHKLARGLKAKSKSFLKVVDRLQAKAVQFARCHEFDGVVLGHTHMARDQRVDGVHYLNSGCWTEHPCGFIGVRGGVPRSYVWSSGLLHLAAPSPRVEPLREPASSGPIPVLEPAAFQVAADLG